MAYLPQNTALRAGLLMVCAMGSFVCNDTIVKIVGKHLPVGELIALRGVMAMTILTAICASQGLLGDLPKIRQKNVLMRSTCDLFATIAFVTALVHMPIANLTSVMQAVPLVVALLSMLFLGEEVGWRRMIAIIGGFIGVLMIVPVLLLITLCAKRMRQPFAFMTLVVLMLGLGLPLLLVGYNHPENPILGALVLSPVELVATSFFYAWLTIRSGSFWPPARAAARTERATRTLSRSPTSHPHSWTPPAPPTQTTPAPWPPSKASEGRP